MARRDSEEAEGERPGDPEGEEDERMGRLEPPFRIRTVDLMGAAV